MKHTELLKLHELCNENQEYCDLINSLKESQRTTLSTINHELRNYLTLIHSTAQLLEAKDNQLSQNQHWNQLVDDIKEMTSLLKEYSVYNHCSDLSIEPTNLITLLQKTVNSFEATALFNHTTLTLDTGSEALDYVTSYPCDPMKMREVFINLIKNALEATSAGDYITIEFKTAPAELIYSNDKNAFISIIVRNSGKLIPNDEIDTLFNPYFTTKSQGSGLGLSIVKEIMLSHNGNISAQSTEKETIFSVELPITKNN